MGVTQVEAGEAGGVVIHRRIEAEHVVCEDCLDRPPAPQVVADPFCPYCKGTKIRAIKTLPQLRRYRCLDCVSPQGEPVTFSVLRRAPPAQDP